MQRFIFLFIFILCIGISLVVYGQESESETLVSTQQDKSGNITLDFKDADIRNVLKVISLKTGMNIVASPDVTGTVTIYLEDVPWETALDVILKTYDFGYEKEANIISVAPLNKIAEQRRMKQELSQVQSTITEVFKLKYIDALDAKNALEPLISSRGKITVLEVTGKSGWEFGGEALGKRARTAGERKSLTKILLITDIPPVMDELRAILDKIDVKPRLIMIEAKILEVSRDFLVDIGFEYSSQTVGAADITVPLADEDATNQDTFAGGAQIISSSGGTPLTTSAFNPLTSTITPETAGIKLILKKLVGSRFEVIMHALEEDANSNLLSAPRIMTLNNQEATILVGEKYPILSTNVSGTDTTTTTTSLDYYEDIGIQLNVVPQISGENQINMIIHPSVTSFSQVVGTNQYPRITTREVETQLLINDGETIVIGGLIKDYKSTSKIGVPWLSKIPILGLFFRRDTTDTAKIELLIFITARIVDESGLSDFDVDVLKDQISEE